jgi:hypothetical protein
VTTNTTHVLDVKPENVPLLLREINQWIVWKAVPKEDGRINKVPIHNISGRKINPHDKANHLPFETALAAYQSGVGNGIGFDLTGEPVSHNENGESLYVVGLDFDKLTEKPHELAYAKSVWQRLNCYKEVSPSGTGIRMFALTRQKPRTGHSEKCEIYTGGRFLTVTGRSASGPIADATEALRALEAEFWPKRKTAPAPNVLSFPSGVTRINRTLLGANWHENEDNIAKIKEVLSFIPANLDHDNWRNATWALASLGWNCGQDLAEEWSATSTAHWQDGGAKALAKIEELFNSYDPERGITVGTLFHLAYEHDMPRPASRDAVHPVPAHNKPARRFNVRTRTELDALPPMRWTIRGAVPETGVAAIFGDPGSGKSFLAIDLVARISTGASEWFGRQLCKRDAVYVALEGQRGVKARIEAWERLNGVRAESLKFLSDSFTLLSDVDVTEFAEAVTAACEPGAVVVIDTLAQATPGADENAGKDMGLVIAAAQYIANAVNGLVILVHHRGKDTSKGLRGHSSLNGAMDAVICVERDKATDRRSWTVQKMKEGEDGATGMFTLETVDLGTVDQFGIQDRSAAVKELTGAAAAVAAALPAPKGPHQKAVYDALKADSNAPAGWSQKSVLEVAKTALSGVSSQHRASRARTAVNGLVDGGALKKDEGGYFHLHPSSTESPITPPL